MAVRVTDIDYRYNYGQPKVDNTLMLQYSDIVKKL